MRMIAEYLDTAIQFEQMASAEQDETLKARLLDQAAAYRELAENRARRLRLPFPGKKPPAPE